MAAKTKKAALAKSPSPEDIKKAQGVAAMALHPTANAAAGLQTPVVALEVVRGNQLDQRCPRYDVFHLFEKFTLACALEADVEVQGGLNVDTMGSGAGRGCGGFAEFP